MTTSTQIPITFWDASSSEIALVSRMSRTPPGGDVAWDA